jgi:integrase
MTSDLKIELFTLGVIHSNPANSLSGIGNTRTEVLIPSHAQLKQILSTDNWEKDALGRAIPLWRTYWLATAFCAYGGLRQGEVLAIQRDNVVKEFFPPVGWEKGDPEKFVPGVFIHHSWDRRYGLKGITTGKSRFVPLPIELINWAYNKHTDGPFIFGGVKPVNYRQLSNAWEQAQKRSKVKAHFTFHSLRHYLNSYLLVEQGMELSKVQAITGHSTEAMSQNYAHASDEVLAEIGKTTAELFKK